jgi:TonB family protein
MNAIFDFLRTDAGALLDGWLTMQLQTGLFVLIVLALDLSLRNVSPRFRYLLWMTALVKALIPPVIFIPSAGPTAAKGIFTLPTISVQALAAEPVTGGLSVSAITIGVLFLSSLLFALFVLMRTLRLRRQLSGARPLQHDAWKRGPKVFVTARIPSPLALGTLRPRIYVTEDIASGPREVLHAVLHHEHAHIERRDGIAVLLQTVVQVFYVLNPMVWLLNIRLFRYREQICDAEALARTGTRAVDYGRLLLRFAEAQPARIVQTGTCFFETRRGFVERISQLFRDRTESRSRRSHRVAVFFLILLVVPLSWRCGEEAPSGTYMQSESTSHERWLGDSTQENAPSLRLGDPIFSTVHFKKEGKYESGHAPRIVGGLQALSELIEYPKEALEAGLEGTVVIQANIRVDGTPVYAHVLSSVHPLLDRAAQNAVLSTRFEAARRNGKICEGDINIPIRFRLQ